MTKRLECIVEGCSATIEGETDEEVLGRAADHAQTAHPDVDLDDELMEDLRSSIRDV